MVARCPVFSLALGFLLSLTLTAGPPPALAQDSLCCYPVVPLGVHTSAGPFIPGCAHEYTIKVSDNYGPLDFSALPAYPGDECGGVGGATALRCYMEHGYWGYIGPGDCLPSQVGNTCGPIRQAVQYRFSSDTDAREGLCYQNYEGNGERVVVCPIIDDVGCSNHVKAAAAFFIKYVPGLGRDCNIIVEFIQEVPGTNPTPVRSSSWGTVKLLYR